MPDPVGILWARGIHVQPQLEKARAALQVEPRAGERPCGGKNPSPPILVPSSHRRTARAHDHPTTTPPAWEMWGEAKGFRPPRARDLIFLFREHCWGCSWAEGERTAVRCCRDWAGSTMGSVETEGTRCVAKDRNKSRARSGCYRLRSDCCRFFLVSFRDRRLVQSEELMRSRPN
ncbi:hypothetical protein BS47DRAFT_561736 [Hydnum rufescens UP504]|uniref:Uncharacterized protein n=1 Tax=Hydnum rufescens UP504 TaxID=1448309 RepID=A0A9P6AH74_9AGAM|nr:hypothetical protein BS47DRAFT_561736 [Hydnum rufescens UP504]